jgi:hypothetical protein
MQTTACVPVLSTSLPVTFGQCGFGPSQCADRASASRRASSDSTVYRPPAALHNDQIVAAIVTVLTKWPPVQGHPVYRYWVAECCRQIVRHRVASFDCQTVYCASDGGWGVARYLDDRNFLRNG